MAQGGPMPAPHALEPKQRLAYVALLLDTVIYSSISRPGPTLTVLSPRRMGEELTT